MTISQQQLESAKDKLRDAFFALAFDFESQEAARQADDALRELDRLLDAAAAGPVDQ